MGIIYEGFFVNPKIDLISTLDKDIEFKHITTEFKPAKTHEYLYGKTARFAIVGYGNDYTNEGVKVNLVSCEDNELVDLFDSIFIPHITLSVSNDGKPVNTSKIDFTNNIPDYLPEVIECIFGGFKGSPVLNN